MRCIVKRERYIGKRVCIEKRDVKYFRIKFEYYNINYFGTRDVHKFDNLTPKKL